MISIYRLFTFPITAQSAIINVAHPAIAYIKVVTLSYISLKCPSKLPSHKALQRK